ncbi:FAD-binding oxidoreductase [Methylophaga muralis]|uniref:Phthalate dioxygenase reductase n=1 Tax=Methylophaga muralis TaxID=291169 RepID=A0A1E3GS66_9GAMM|nr:FAD-binding oxidoreductase [Methylophaga muralis]ODN66854.1 Phthalate dioxygenase reductase [Methylophaga muralis]
MSQLNVIVTAVEPITDLVKQFTFELEDGGKLPYFSGGSHVVVAMNIDGRVHRNAYSLMGPTSDNGRYTIAVRKQEKSRGGSVFMHEHVKPGSRLQITPPTICFPLTNWPKNIFWWPVVLALPRSCHKSAI